MLQQTPLRSNAFKIRFDIPFPQPGPDIRRFPDVLRGKHGCRAKHPGALRISRLLKHLQSAERGLQRIPAAGEPVVDLRIERIEFDHHAAVLFQKKTGMIRRHQTAVGENFRPHAERNDITDHIVKSGINQRFASENHNLARSEFLRLRNRGTDLLRAHLLRVIRILRRCVAVGTAVIAAARELNLHRQEFTALHRADLFIGIVKQVHRSPHMRE